MSEIDSIHRKLLSVVEEWAEQKSPDGNVQEVEEERERLANYLNGRFDEHQRSDFWMLELLELPDTRHVKDGSKEHQEITEFLFKNIENIKDIVDDHMGWSGDAYGSKCPLGMVQVEFVGNNPRDRISSYGWRPTKGSFIELYIDGRRIRIDVGDYNDGEPRRGLHMIFDMSFDFEKTSMNAASLYYKKGQQP